MIYFKRKEQRYVISLYKEKTVCHELHKLNLIQWLLHRYTFFRYIYNKFRSKQNK